MRAGATAEAACAPANRAPNAMVLFCSFRPTELCHKLCHKLCRLFTLASTDNIPTKLKTKIARTLKYTRLQVEMVLFIGIPATGKSSFYRERFFRSHVRVNLDMLRTRHREQLLIR